MFFIRVVFTNIENLLFYRRISKSCISQFNPVVSVASAYYIIYLLEVYSLVCQYVCASLNVAYKTHIIN